MTTFIWTMDGYLQDIQKIRISKVRVRLVEDPTSQYNHPLECVKDLFVHVRRATAAQ